MAILLLWFPLSVEQIQTFINNVHTFLEQKECAKRSSDIWWENRNQRFLLHSLKCSENEIVQYKRD